MTHANCVALAPQIGLDHVDLSGRNFESNYVPGCTVYDGQYGNDLHSNSAFPNGSYAQTPGNDQFVICDVTNDPSLLASPTCGDVKHIYQSSACCGSPLGNAKEIVNSGLWHITYNTPSPPPPHAPPMAPQTEAEHNTRLLDMASAWCADKAAATATYGHINTWITTGVTDMSGLFCASSYTSDGSVNCRSMSNCKCSKSDFDDCYDQWEGVDLSNWDTSQVTTMAGMFSSNKKFNAPLRNWDTSKVTDMSYMFYDTDRFNQDISHFVTSSVTTMESMFKWGDSFNQDLITWDTSSVTTMKELFYGQSNFNGDVSNWDTSNVTDMTRLFQTCKKFTGDVSAWDTSSVTNMHGTFCDNYLFQSDLSNWDVSKVTDMGQMFQSTCYATIPTSWDTSKVTHMNAMFHNHGFGEECAQNSVGGYGMEQLPPNFDTSSVITMRQMFDNSKYAGHVDMFDTSSVVEMYRMFYKNEDFNHPIDFDISSIGTKDQIVSVLPDTSTYQRVDGFDKIFDETSIAECTMKDTYDNLLQTDIHNLWYYGYGGSYLRTLCRAYGTVLQTIHFKLNVTGTSIENSVCSNNASCAVPRLSGGYFVKNGPQMVFENGLWNYVHHFPLSELPGTDIGYKFAWGDNVAADWGNSESQASLQACGNSDNTYDRQTRIPEGHYVIEQTFEDCKASGPLAGDPAFVWSSPPPSPPPEPPSPPPPSPPAPAPPPAPMTLGTFQWQYKCRDGVYYHSCWESEMSWKITCTKDGTATDVIPTQDIVSHWNAGGLLPFEPVLAASGSTCIMTLFDSFGDGWVGDRPGQIIIHGFSTIAYTDENGATVDMFDTLTFTAGHEKSYTFTML